MTFHNFETFDVLPEEDTGLRAAFYLRLETKMINHTRNVMLLFDFLGKIGGLNRLLWTLGFLAIKYLYKDRITVEILESMYVLKDNGEEI